MQNEKYVFAMYDVRGKQEFIYRSNKCKEIVGGSRLIADVFHDYLFPAAKEYCGLPVNANKEMIYTPELDEDSSGDSLIKNFKDRIENGTYIGEVVYEGGGNFFVLYRDKETCIGINRIFTKNILKNIGTLQVLCTYIEDVDFDNYQEDQRRLFKKHQVHEAQECIPGIVNATPFTAVSPEGSRPFTGTVKLSGKGIQKVTTEQLAKYKKYDQYINCMEPEVYDKEEYLLDNLVTKRGEESLLAVVYIDGNGMGAKVADLLKDEKNYDDCVNRLRKFSEQIDRTFVQERVRNINRMLEEKYQGIKDKVRRTIVAAGDEMTIICNARDALDVVKAYFKGLRPEDGSSCAGIAIFHSHSPYADAYRIAEECCENAKTVMKKTGVLNVNLMDFHYCQGGTGISLESIRQRNGTKDCNSLPWKFDVRESNGDRTESEVMITPVCNIAELCMQGGSERYENAVNRMVSEWRDKKLARSNIKVLRDAAQTGPVETEIEIKRINAHRPKEDPITFDISKNPDNNAWEYKEHRRRVIYDISLVYDLWFRGEQKG